jgi:phage/plasmid primase-like uncharacterized protein
VSFRDGDDGRLLAFCFGGCGFTDILAAVENDPLDGDDDADDRGVAAPRPSERERVDLALRLYDRLAPAAGTIAEAYLRSRGITIAVPSVLRFGACPHRRGGDHPALVAPVVDADGALIGTHATFLRADGAGKAGFADPDHQRETRGVIRGGKIRLAPHDHNHELLVAEGVETALSAMQILGLPGWSTVSASGLGTVALPPAVRRICIAADNDLAGRQAAVGAHRRWTAEGRTVRIVMPTAAGTDFNDVLRGR